jgi:hypothetical protein
VAGLFDRDLWTLRELVRQGGGLELPDGSVVRPVKLGRFYHWPAAPIRRALGLEDGSDPGHHSGAAHHDAPTGRPVTTAERDGRDRTACWDGPGGG